MFFGKNNYEFWGEYYEFWGEYYEFWRRILWVLENIMSFRKSIIFWGRIL